MPHLILEIHRYAPELNKAHVSRRGAIVATLAAPGCRTIAEARAKLFPRVRVGRLVRLALIRPEPWQGLNRERGRALYPLGGDSLRDIVAHARALAFPESKPATLIDGRTLPAATPVLTSRLIG